MNNNPSILPEICNLQLKAFTVQVTSPATSLKTDAGVLRLIGVISLCAGVFSTRCVQLSPLSAGSGR